MPGMLLRRLSATQLGNRGLTAGSRPAEYGIGLSMAEYVEEANHEALVCGQLEEEQALQNIDEILQVGGVDVYSIGPSDLSRSMGYPWGPTFPRYESDGLGLREHSSRLTGCQVQRDTPRRFSTT